MKKLLTALLFCCGTALSFQAQATHPYGTYLTYENVAPNVYRIDFRYARPCGNVAAGLPQLTYRAVGCSPLTGSKSLPLVNTASSSGIYAAGAPTSCTVPGAGATTNLDFEILTYSDTITLPAACSNWVIGVTTTGRGPSANTVQGSVGSGHVYIEAMVNNTNGVVNHSPQFYHTPLAALPLNQITTFSHNAFDPDGDSLVYSLQPIQGGYQMPWPYPTGFSAQQPFGPNASVGLNLDAATGLMEVMPNYFNGSWQMNNIYFIGIQIEEYRNVNGNYEKIGHIRNDIPMWIINDTTNKNPAISAITVNNTSYNSGDIVDVAVGMPVNLQLQASDLDIMDQLRVTSNYDQVLNNANVTVTGSSANPTYRLNWTPTASDVRDQPYYLAIDVKDNHSPLNGSTTHIIGFRVSSVASAKDRMVVNSPLIPSMLVRGQAFRLDEQLQGAQVTVVNAQGQVVKKVDHYQNNWTGDNLAAGMYFYRVTPKGARNGYAGKVLLVD